MFEIEFTSALEMFMREVNMGKMAQAEIDRVKIQNLCLHMNVEEMAGDSREEL